MEYISNIVEVISSLGHTKKKQIVGKHKSTINIESDWKKLS